LERQARRHRSRPASERDGENPAVPGVHGDPGPQPGRGDQPPVHRIPDAGSGTGAHHRLLAGSPSLRCRQRSPDRFAGRGRERSQKQRGNPVRDPRSGTPAIAGMSPSERREAKIRSQRRPPGEAGAPVPRRPRGCRSGPAGYPPPPPNNGWWKSAARVRNLVRGCRVGRSSWRHPHPRADGATTSHPRRNVPACSVAHSNVHAPARPAGGESGREVLLLVRPARALAVRHLI
jgi:hypothetical protein